MKTSFHFVSIPKCVGHILRRTVVLGLILSVFSQLALAARPPFPELGAVKPECRAIANSILTDVLEHEGLFTMFGGLKPMSYVSVSSYGERAGEYLPAVTQLHQDATAALSDGDLTFRMQFWNERKPRVALVYVFRHSLLRAKIREHAARFKTEGIDPEMPIETLVDRVMKSDFRDADRVDGLFYGFPEHAVDFFCHPQKYSPPNTLRRLDSDRRGVRIETYHPRAAFVYVLPIQGELTTADIQLSFAARPVLEEFRRRRPFHVSPTGALDAVALVRRWTLESADVATVAVLPSNPNVAGRATAPPAARAWMPAWMGNWIGVRAGGSHLVVITDDGAADSLRFELKSTNMYFQFRLSPGAGTDGVQLVPVTSTNSYHEEKSFVLERTSDSQWRLSSRFNQKAREERERSEKARNVTNPTPPNPNPFYSWGEFKRAPSVQEAITRGMSEQWARPLSPRPAGAADGAIASGSVRPETGPTTFDPRWHEFEFYLREFAAAVQHNMYTQLLESEAKPPRATACVLRFTLNARGEIANVAPQGQVYSPASLQVARDALRGTFRHWTPEMVARLGGEQVITFMFYFDY